MISPGVCADFDFNLLCFHFYLSHGTFFLFLKISFIQGPTVVSP